MNKHLKKALLFIALLGVGIAMVHSKTVIAEPKPQVTVEQNKDSLDLWIESLSGVELPDYLPRDTCVVDTNGKLSCGCLQYQYETFSSWALKPKFRNQLSPNAEDSDILNLYKDCDYQKQLTRVVLLDNPKEWRNWYTSVIKKGVGLPPNLREGGTVSR